MTFAWRETVGGLNHLRLRAERSCFGRPADWYLSPAVESGLAEPVSLHDGQMEVCWICGFALARITLPGEWTLETCSATGLRHVLNNERLGQWSKLLAKTVSSVGTLPGSKV